MREKLLPAVHVILRLGVRAWIPSVPTSPSFIHDWSRKKPITTNSAAARRHSITEWPEHINTNGDTVETTHTRAVQRHDTVPRWRRIWLLAP